jgi:hypothetical protein
MKSMNFHNFLSVTKAIGDILLTRPTPRKSSGGIVLAEPKMRVDREKMKRSKELIIS